MTRSIACVFVSLLSVAAAGCSVSTRSAHTGDAVVAATTSASRVAADQVQTRTTYVVQGEQGAQPRYNVPTYWNLPTTTLGYNELRPTDMELWGALDATLDSMPRPAASVMPREQVDAYVQNDLAGYLAFAMRLLNELDQAAEQATPARALMLHRMQLPLLASISEVLRSTPMPQEIVHDRAEQMVFRARSCGMLAGVALRSEHAIESIQDAHDDLVSQWAQRSGLVQQRLALSADVCPSGLFDVARQMSAANARRFGTRERKR